MSWQLHCIVYPASQYLVQSCLISSLQTWMMGQSSPSASLPMTQNWEELLILASSGTSTCCRNWLIKSSMFNKVKCKVLLLEEQLQCQYMLRAVQLESNLAEKHLAVLMDDKLNMCHCHKECYWVALGGLLPAGHGWWQFPSFQPWRGNTWSAVSSSVLLSTVETRI